MRLGPLFVCVRACMCARPRACVSVYERERERDTRVGVCMCACGCVVAGGDIVMGVGVKADRMRIVIILVPRI